ncbi:MAG: hypothetical protein ABIM21_07450, partial [candidate division WOR-3 bacterium]
WELRPEGQAPAGIAAIFYFLFIPKPWVLLPFNACVHAFGGLVLFYLVRDIVRDAKIALISALPFVFFPSAMSWYTQIHKDGIFALGVLLFLWGWERLLRVDEQHWWSLWLSLGLVLLGALTIWVVRPYAVEILWFFSFVLALVLSGVAFMQRQSGTKRGNMDKEGYPFVVQQNKALAIGIFRRKSAILLQSRSPTTFFDSYENLPRAH